MIIGCCGFCTSMNNYFKEYRAVEVQKTFYKPPGVETAKRWRREADKVNREFEFTVKAWQLITHPPSSPTYRRTNISVKLCGYFRLSKTVIEAWEKTKEIADVLRAKVIVFQTPFSFKDREENAKRVVEFFSTIENGYYFVWEARGWSSKSVREVCEKAGLIHCVDPMVEDPAIEREVMYFRLHGHSPDCRYKPYGKLNYRHVYSKEELEWLKNYLKKFSGTTYVMFNNTNMCKDAKKFEKILTI